MAKRLPLPKDSKGMRLDWSESNAKSLDLAAAQCGLAVASFTRLSLEMLVERGSVTVKEVQAEAERMIAVMAKNKISRGKKKLKE